jgi:hypothetical protein
MLWIDMKEGTLGAVKKIAERKEFSVKNVRNLKEER